jgi:hypothetical protein
VVKRKNVPGSPFSEWLYDIKNHGMDPRENDIRVSDMDWIIWKKEDYDFGDGPFMMIEEKCYNKPMQPDQGLLFYSLDKILKTSKYYQGFHLLRFEKTTPDDGAIFLDEKWITKADLIQFWQFGKPSEWYVSWFYKLKADGINWRQKCEKRDSSYYN